MAKDPYQYFRPEARDIAEQLGQGLLELEKGGGPEVVARLLRLAHTLKGAARVVKQAEVAERAHAIEDALAPFRESTAGMATARVDTILALVDEINGRVAQLSPPAPPGVAAPAETFRTLWAGVAETDAVLHGITESHAQLNSMREAGRSVERIRDLADVLVKQLAMRGARDTTSAGVTAGNAYATADELRHVAGALDRQLGSSADRIDRELRLAREAAEHLRLAPAGSMFTALERTARDTAHEVGTRVTVVTSGGDVRLEAPVLAAVQAALVQATRNAVAHGIEPEHIRLLARKPVAGTVTIEVLRRGRRVIFRCGDDGRGVDLEAVRRMAARRGLSAAETKKLNAQDLLHLLLRGGLSTSTTVTEIAGRGIGLDVMRAVAEQLRGEATILTEEGRGTTVELNLPLSQASLEALVVEADDVSATIPLDSIRETRRVASRDVTRAAQNETLVYQGEAIPFIALSRALHRRSASSHANRVWSAVIVEGSGGIAAIGVDRLLGTARVVLRSLPALAPANDVVAGASLDAAGNPQLVLDTDGLIAEARREGAAEIESPAERLPLLVVDDSLTTRMLEQSILESAGYEVDTATSAEQGLESARRRRYGLILVDVEMPGMDGFAFIEHVRADPALHHVPAIMVTSRASIEDRQRGLQAGAHDFIVKSEFNQAVLLARIKQLLG